jgi:hypothetical protein
MTEIPYYPSYVGVDLDGTLAKHERNTLSEIGEPIPSIVERVQRMINEGIEVRIFSARCVEIDGAGNPLFNIEQVRAIEAWCAKHIGKVLKVQYWKDCGMKELWDDRAVQIIPNDGIAVIELLHHCQSNLLEVVRMAYATKGRLPRQMVDDLARSIGFPVPVTGDENVPLIIPANSIPAVKK